LRLSSGSFFFFLFAIVWFLFLSRKYCANEHFLKHGVWPVFGLQSVTYKILKHMSVGLQIAYLFLLAIPVACISWTVTHEEVFREPREFFIDRSKNSRSAVTRKFFFLLICEYCFSHYITIGVLLLTRFQLLYDDWKGYVIAGFSLVWIANIYMGLYSLIRLDIKKDKIEIKEKEKEKENK
jgi:hypothetical protein